MRFRMLTATAAFVAAALALTACTGTPAPLSSAEPAPSNVSTAPLPNPSPSLYAESVQPLDNGVAISGSLVNMPSESGMFFAYHSADPAAVPYVLLDNLDGMRAEQPDPSTHSIRFGRDVPSPKLYGLSYPNGALVCIVIGNADQLDRWLQGLPKSGNGSPTGDIREVSATAPACFTVSTS